MSDRWQSGSTGKSDTGEFEQTTAIHCGLPEDVAVSWIAPPPCDSTLLQNALGLPDLVHERKSLCLRPPVWPRTCLGHAQAVVMLAFVDDGEAEPLI